MLPIQDFGGLTGARAVSGRDLWRQACRWYDRALETLRALRAAGVPPIPPESEVDAVARERAGRCGR